MGSATQEELLSTLHNVIQKYDQIYQYSVLLASSCDSQRDEPCVTEPSCGISSTPKAAQTATGPKGTHSVKGTGQRVPLTKAQASRCTRANGPIQRPVPSQALSPQKTATITRLCHANRISEDVLSQDYLKAFLKLANLADSPLQSSPQSKKESERIHCSARIGVIRNAAVHTCQVGWAGYRSGPRSIHCTACHNQRSKVRQLKLKSTPVSDCPGKSPGNPSYKPGATATTVAKEEAAITTDQRISPTRQPPRNYHRLGLGQGIESKTAALQSKSIHRHRERQPTCPTHPRKPSGGPVPKSGAPRQSAAAPTETSDQAGHVQYSSSSQNVGPSFKGPSAKAPSGCSPLLGEEKALLPQSDRAHLLRHIMQTMPWALNPAVLQALQQTTKYQQVDQDKDSPSLKIKSQLLPLSQSQSSLTISASSTDFIYQLTQEGDEEEECEEEEDEQEDDEEVVEEEQEASESSMEFSIKSLTQPIPLGYLRNLQSYSSIQQLQYGLPQTRTAGLPAVHQEQPFMKQCANFPGPQADYDVVQEDAIIIHGQPEPPRCTADRFAAVRYHQGLQSPELHQELVEMQEIMASEACDSHDFIKLKVQEWLKST
uniref:Uncharacterized protein n=1 Tax=Eutreptiella gymnastica TaxID=73025 RepID=A0A6U8L5E6_9EUGL|mmetsp:Transcript_75634/g.133639  ORF Transcript_75634/g.133639 Transcript_75634/m.133639 type:complete len:600 (+) Transcript_75634:52-1851(+)